MACEKMGWKVNKNPATEFTFYPKGSEPTEGTEQEWQESEIPDWLSW